MNEVRIPSGSSTILDKVEEDLLLASGATVGAKDPHGLEVSGTIHFI